MLTSNGRPRRITEIKRSLQRISHDRTALSSSSLCETQITNDFENSSSKPRRNDYVPVSGVNAESRRLTAGGCCLLRSKRSIAGPARTETRLHLQLWCPSTGPHSPDSDW